MNYDTWQVSEHTIKQSVTTKNMVIEPLFS